MRSIPIFIFFVVVWIGSTAQEEIVIQRLEAIQQTVPLDYNKHVKAYIDVYTVRKKELSSKILGRSEYYFPTIEQIFSEEGIPDEMKYLACVESALNPRAVSRKGATGLWQFMYSTGREYGLKISSYTDDRKDIEKSTRASAQYFKRMHIKFGSWLHVIASYNCGPGNVNRAYKRSGRKSNFWDIYPYLPRETRGYVPAYIATVYMMKYYDQFGIYPKYDDYLRMAKEEIRISNKLLIEEVCNGLSIETELLKMMNPVLSGNVVPSDFRLTLPRESLSTFASIEDSLYAISYRKIKNQPTKQVFVAGLMDRIVPLDTNLKSVIYTVKEGDNIGFLASWFDVGVRDIRMWNGLRSNKIILGQELLIYVDREKIDHYQRFDLLSKRIKTLLSTDQHKRTLFAKNKDPNYNYHKVENGESLWIISRKYPDCSIESIRELNGLPNNNIRPGMYLKVAPKS